MYLMDIKVQVPVKISVEDLGKELSRVGEKLNLDISIH
jgi:glycine cleavage system regulatory protein